MGPAVKLIGKGLQTNKVFELVLTQEKLALLETAAWSRPKSNPNWSNSANSSPSTASSKTRR
jgi:hypothetical protein